MTLDPDRDTDCVHCGRQHSEWDCKYARPGEPSAAAIRIEVYKTRSLLRRQRYGFRVIAANGEQVAQGEGYARRTDARERGEWLVGQAHAFTVEYL